MKNRFHLYLLLLLAVLSAVDLMAQAPLTSASGVVIDGDTGEPLPYAMVLFVGSQIGTTTDEEGRFSLSNIEGFVTLAVQMMSYKTSVITLTPGKSIENLKIVLELDGFGIQAVTVKPSRKNKYSKKDNPAVDLIREVIAHKNENRLSSRDFYRASTYEKTTLSLDKFDFDFDSSRFWRNFAFVKDYVDSSKFANTKVLTVSLWESLHTLKFGEGVTCYDYDIGLGHGMGGGKPDSAATASDDTNFLHDFMPL